CHTGRRSEPALFQIGPAASVAGGPCALEDAAAPGASRHPRGVTIMSVPSDRALPTPAISDAGSAYLDGLRALGATLVIVAHVLALYFGIKRYPFGSLGVTIFFLLSRFLIMQSMLSRAARPGVHVPAFMADRTARILTPYVPALDRKSTRLNSSHVKISYAVF